MKEPVVLKDDVLAVVRSCITVRDDNHDSVEELVEALYALIKNKSAAAECNCSALPDYRSMTFRQFADAWTL